MGFEELLNQTVKAFVIIINRRPKGKPRKMEDQTIGELRCVLIFNIIFFPKKKDF